MTIKKGLSIFAKSIGLLGVLCVVLYLLFSSQISAFWYNLYEAQSAVEMSKIFSESSKTEDALARREQISQTLSYNISDLDWLKNEVIAHLYAEKTALDKLETINNKQSKIPLLNSRLANYNKKKIAWTTASQKYVELFIEVKNIEYRINNIATNLVEAGNLINPNNNKDTSTWKDNFVKGNAIAMTMLDEIHKATADGILTPDLATVLTNQAKDIENHANPSLQLLNGEISLDAYQSEMQKINSQSTSQTFSEAMDMVSSWRAASLTTKEQHRLKAATDVSTAEEAMGTSMTNAPILDDPITQFFTKIHWLKYPNLDIQEPKTITLLQSEINQIEAMIKDPDMLFFREAVNSYVLGDGKVCIANGAKQKKQDGEKLSGLDLFDPLYFKSKFYPVTSNINKSNLNTIRVLFIDKPDRVFTAQISLKNGNRCLETFTTDDAENKANIPDLITKYKKYVFDPQYAL